MPRGKKGKNGTKKIGRNQAKCQVYKLRKKREKNKIRKLTKLLKRQPKNKDIPKAITKYQKLLG